MQKQNKIEISSPKIFTFATVIQGSNKAHVINRQKKVKKLPDALSAFGLFGLSLGGLVSLLLRRLLLLVVDTLVPVELGQDVVQDLELVRREEEVQQFPDAHHDDQLKHEPKRH